MSHKLAGDLTHAQVTRHYGQSRAWLRSGQMPQIVDLSGVARCDSSALALLLEWLRWARRLGQPMRFVNPPQNLVRIARLCQADGVLGFGQGED